MSKRRIARILNRSICEFSDKMKKPKEDRFGYPMNFRAYFTRGIIWGQRLVFSRLLNGINDHRPIPPDYVGEAANDAIRKLLEGPAPCLVARFGCVELDAILRGYDIARKGSRFAKFAKLFTGAYGPFWWDNSIKKNLLCTTGVFPADEETLMHFSRQALEDSRQLDILGSWNARELELKRAFYPTAKGVSLVDLEPFFRKEPWSQALEGKKVLVVHPFDATIREQYARRERLFDDARILPKFELVTYRPVQSFLGPKTPYRDWFEALGKMCADIAKIDFDVALLGCGAYGMSLGAFIKRDMGRKAVHLGGVTQVLFGIKGGRYDPNPYYNRLYNDFWVRPSENERPSNFIQHEGGAYW